MVPTLKRDGQLVMPVRNRKDYIMLSRSVAVTQEIGKSFGRLYLDASIVPEDLLEVAD